ncbi:PTPRT [Branchiostoma lanceolatum]|uniref:protein-tyrosine-phosphatase n=1 Tax=Branchiostoma lanceolatum TaxID=7740 RepID=A0A8J9YXA3_BRALA|nr:PTPRT [Branchiostoma lanceolatum]
MADFGRYFLVGVLLNAPVLYTDGVDVAILNQYPLIPHLPSDGSTVLTCITDGLVQGSTSNSDFYIKVEYSPGGTTLTTRRSTTTTPSAAAPTKVVATINAPPATNDNERQDVVGVFSCSGTKDGVTRKVSTVKILNTACLKPLAYTYRATVGDDVRIKVTTTSFCTPAGRTSIVLMRTDGSTATSREHGGQHGEYELVLNSVSAADDGTYIIVYNDVSYTDKLASYIRIIVSTCRPDRTGPDCSLPCLCYHGGRCNEDGSCICPPGFFGDNCELACSQSSLYGQSCRWSCNDGNPVRPCRRSLICLPDPYGCECANGYKGFDCDTACGTSEYGPGCTQTCTCRNGGTCNRYQGCLCIGDWRGPTCEEKKFRISVLPTTVHITNAASTPATVTCSCHPWTIDDCPDMAIEYDTDQVTVTAESTESARQKTWSFTPPTALVEVEFTCAVNYNGVRYTDGSTISVTGRAPSIIEYPIDSIEVNSGQDVTISCTADGDPAPTQDDILLKNLRTGQNYQPSRVSSSGDSLRAMFDITSLTSSNGGQYVCEGQTIAGSFTSHRSQIYIKEQPVPRESPRVTETNIRYIIVDFNIVAYDGDGPIVNTTLLHRERPSGSWIETPVSNSSAYYPLRGLMGDTQYELAVVLTRPGAGGRGSMGPSASIRTAHPPVDGGWSEWDDWSPCSLSCGNGTRTRTRTCDSPNPAYGGQDCAGAESETQACPDQPDCPAGVSMGVIAGAAGGSAALVLVLVAVAVFIFWRRRRGKESSRAPPANVPMSQFPSSSMKKDSQQDDAVDTRNRNTAEADVPPTAAAPSARPVTYGPVQLDQLVAYVKKQHANSDAGFKAEYKSLRDGQLHPWDVARQVYNKKKNRYGNIVTYDHSRVVMGCDPSSDYINASYIKGYKKEKMYIAAQGPNKATIADLWRMAWQEKSPCIVMVTNLMENNKVKCERYWPDNTQTEHYGDFGVTCMREDVLTDFTMRKFHLFQASDGKKFHEIYQYQFTVWPDHGVPTYASPLMALRNRVKEHVTPESGPIIVHCSAGVGRTGTFIMLDMMMEMFKEEEQVDIFNRVNELREQRINMVQTSDQYIFIYDALLEAIVCGDTAVPSDQFRTRFQILRQKPRGGGPSELMIQFIALRSLTPIVNPKECRDGRAAENKKKNRRSDDLPSDRARPFLMSPGDEAGTNYINAAFINGYKQRDVYIATQAPLPNTIVDMWRLVYDYRISTVVMLNDMDGGDPTCPRYWPDPKQSVQHGMFLVDHVDDTQDGHLVTRTLKLQNTVKTTEAARTVKIFQLTGWPRDQKTPPSPCQAAMITLLSEVERWQQQTGNEPIVVHCIDGVERSGVFCALGVACERVKVEQVVDIFQAVKTVRACRPTMVNDVAAYECCHQLVIEYLKGFDTYANFG